MVGVVSSINYYAAALGQTRQNFFTQLDRNGDGAIDKSEMALARATVEMSITDILKETDSYSGSIISSNDLSSALTASQSNLSLSSLGGTDTEQSQTNSIFDTIMKTYTSRISTGSESSSVQSSGLISLLA